ncbi:unnamed protein product [Closterium sp. NIES-64]|nr:unnamed protein product [Closterium sp. NIES-64]
MVIRLRGSRNLRQRLVYATLSGRAIRIDDIRAEAESPGLTEYEASLLRLLEKISNGCVVEINETDQICFPHRHLGPLQHPSLPCPSRTTTLSPLSNGPCIISILSHSLRCPFPSLTSSTRHVPPLSLPHPPFPNLQTIPSRAHPRPPAGVTNDDRDPSIDTLRTATLPILKRFGVDMAEVELKLVRRGAPPLGGGEVMLRLPIVKQLEVRWKGLGAEDKGREGWMGRAISEVVVWEDEGLVKRVRGVAFTARVAPQVANRMVDAARGVLNRLLPDVFIFTDHFSGADSGRLVVSLSLVWGGGEGKARGVLNRLLPDVFIFTDHFSGADSGRSPGFGISLVAETTSGCLLSAERAIASCRGEHEGVGGGAGRGGRGGAGGQGEEVPEDLGLQAAQLLLHEVKQGGVVDGSQQVSDRKEGKRVKLEGRYEGSEVVAEELCWVRVGQWTLASPHITSFPPASLPLIPLPQAFVLLLCALCPEELCRVRVGPLTPHTVDALRDMRAMLGVQFDIRPDESTGTVFLSCIGSGHKNLAKPVT